MKKILSLYEKWILKKTSSKKFLLYDCIKKKDKDRLIKLFINLKSLYKEEKKLWKELQKKINDIIHKYNIVFANDRWIIYNLDIFNTQNINNVYYPLLLNDNLTDKIYKIFNNYDFIKNKEDNEVLKIKIEKRKELKQLDLFLTKDLKKDIDNIIKTLIKELRLSLLNSRDILSNKYKNNDSIFLFIEKNRYFFWYLANNKLIPFNISIINKKITLSRDFLYTKILNKKNFLFANIEYYKIQKINKHLVKDVLEKNYNFNSTIDLFDIFDIKDIKKRDVKKYIEKL